jgi:hypothetical protein
MEGTSHRSDSFIQSVLENEQGHEIIVRTSKVTPSKEYGEIEMRVDGPHSCHSWVVSMVEAKEVNRQLAQMIRHIKDNQKKTTKKKSRNGSEDEA